jgi:hypothetical protein
VVVLTSGYDLVSKFSLGSQSIFNRSKVINSTDLVIN